jgi:protein-L-isoaspartate(D-aspartate) O-methyltransferase
MTGFADDAIDRRRRARLARALIPGSDPYFPKPDPRVLAAIGDLPRHWFVPAEARALAYDDDALAIGAGQTISQPRVVAAMLSVLRLREGMRVLDLGAGSGYAAALLAKLVGPGGSVLAIERQGALIARAQAALDAAAAHDPHAAPVTLRHGDGLAVTDGPFDAIHVACALEELPPALPARLALGGRLVAPVGPHGGVQRLVVLHAVNGAVVEEKNLGEVLFVPGLPGIANSD